ncbi:MAG: amidohydrolase family protein, partial [Candidatus Humimicrobiaceae bacterium]
PDFLFGLLVFNPNFSDSSLESIKKNYQRKQIVGIKIHPFWHMCYPGDYRYKKLWDFACENGIPVLTHTWNPNVANKGQKFADPFLFEDILTNWQGIKLIFAHAGGRGEYLYKVIDLMEKYQDLFVDFAGDIFEPGLIETYVSRVGSERIFFGTDMPWIDIRYYLVNIMSADIENQDKENILGKNASKFFNI